VSLHVGQRTYPDGDMHKEIMRRPGGAKSEEELQRLVNLPPGVRISSVSLYAVLLMFC
jgi:hypothetical protein